MSDTGIATSGTSTVRSEPRKRKMTTMTMSTVSTSVCATSWMALSMYSVASKAIVACMPGRQLALDRRPSPRARASMTSSELAFGSTQTPMNTARLAGEAHVLVVVVGAEHDVGHVFEAHQRAALLRG